MGPGAGKYHHIILSNFKLYDMQSSLRETKASVMFHGMTLHCDVINVYKPILPSHDFLWATIPWKTNICFVCVHCWWLAGKNI